ncbi:MAG: sensor histidine kinase [Almyronema sp.]
MVADVTEQEAAEVALTHQLRQQAGVAQLSQSALLGLPLAALFDQTTQLVAESLGVEYGKILELLPSDQSLLLVAGVGWQSGWVGQAIVSGDRHSQAGYTLLSQQPVIVQDLRTETRFQSSPLLTQHGVVSGISLLIAGKGDRPFGVLGAYSRQRHSFTPDDVNFLQAIANLLAAAIERKRTEQALYQLNLTLEQRVQERTQALNEAMHEMEAFSYSVAHDLRAPLRAIQGFAQVLEEDYQGALDDLGRDYVRRMATSAENLDVLIQDLLAYSRLGRTEIHLQRVNVTNLIQKVLADLAPLLQANQASVEIAPNLPSVCAQRSVLRQVLSNLMGNALKFVPPSGRPCIRVWADTSTVATAPPPAQRVRLWVEDNGIGIAPRHQKRIFKPFERLHGVETYPGTGIGLAIVKRGVERMGGQVGVESAVSQGSRFWIELAKA